MTLPQYTPNPNNYPSTISEVDDSTPPTAANWNPGTEALADRTAFTHASLVALALSDWPTIVPSGSSGIYITGASGFPGLDATEQINLVSNVGVYEPVYGAWITGISIVDTAENKLYILSTLDSGRKWGFLWNGAGYTGTLSIQALATDGAGNVFVVYPLATGKWQVLKIQPTGEPTGWVNSGTLATDCTAFWLSGASKFVEVGGAISGTTLTGEAYSAVLASLAPVSLTSTLPTSWQTYTTHAVSAVTQNKYFQSAVRTDGALALVSLSGKPGTDTSHIMTCDASLTFTDLGAIAPLASSAAVVAITYSEFDALWGVLTYDGTTSKLWTTPDLTTWTTVKSWTGLAGGLAVVQGVWVVSAPFVSVVTDVSPSSTTRITISVDVATMGASSSWHWTNGSYYGLVPPVLISNGAQIMLLDYAGGAGSVATGPIFSKVVGLV